MIYVNIYDNDQVEPYWLGHEAPITLSAAPEGISLVFHSEMEGQKIELAFHPAMIKLLQNWIDAQPKYTFMAKEGKEAMIAEIEAFDKEWDAMEAEKRRAAASKQDGIAPPF